MSLKQRVADRYRKRQGQRVQVQPQQPQTEYVYVPVVQRVIQQRPRRPVVSTEKKEKTGLEGLRQGLEFLDKT
jgi:hypothetical protein